MEADDAGRTEAGDGMHSLEEYGSLMETDITNLNPLAGHNEGQAFTHPLSNVSGQDSGRMGECSETTLEIRIKTLDSSTYTVRVEKDISVPALKQQLASVVGVAAENQRLICRGRVLKDDRLLSSYNVEDGHTLHMVARHLPQPSSTGGDGHGFQGPLDGSATSPESRPAQVTHSVLVGTINVPDVGEGGVPDLNRIISAVLNSVGSGNATFGSGNGPFENISGIGDTTGIPFVQAHTSAEGQARILTGNARQQAGLGSRRLSPEPPSLRHLEVSPDSLTTMSLYLNRMEQALLASGYGGDETIRTLSGASQLQSSSHSSSGDRQDLNETVRLPTSRESLTPAALGLLVRRVNGLLRTQAGGVLSSLASSLENESTLVDGAARVEVQSAAAWSGNILQQLGALLLELGRTTLTLHMGHSPADAVVNSGPSLFISSVGPNPMMVQPPPLLPATVPLGAFSSGSAQPSGPGSPWPGSGLGPRSVNIHIHTSDLGGFLSSASDGSPPNNQQTSTGATAADISSSLEQHLEPAIRVNNLDVGERAPAPQDNDRAASSSGAQAGNAEPILQLSPVQGAIMIMQENGAMRMLPMRTRSAGVGVRPTSTTTTEGAGTSRMLFHPLIPRFQQSSSPFHISQSIRPPALGAFQQFQSNDSLSRAANSRPVLPPAIVQLSRVSQALQPALQSRGQLQNLTPAFHGDEWLPQASGGDVELASEILPSQLFDTTLSLQQQNIINTGEQTPNSPGGPNVVQGQTSASTAINAWEQPNVGATDAAVAVPELSRAELCNNNNQSTSVGDVILASERGSTHSTAMEVGQGDQLPEELPELGGTDIPCSHTEEAKRDSKDRGFSIFEDDTKSGGTERSLESATTQKSADELHQGLPTTESLVIERALQSGISTVNQVISKSNVGNLFSALEGSTGGVTDGGSGGSFNLITRSPVLENYLDTTTLIPEANDLESPTPSDHVLTCSNMTPAVHQTSPDGDTLVIGGERQPGSRMNNRDISSSNIGDMFSVLDRNNGILSAGGSGVSNNLILTRSPVLENFFHTTMQRVEANDVESFTSSDQGLNRSNIRTAMHQASPADCQLKPSLLSRVDVQPFSTMKENSNQCDLIERWNLFPGQGSNALRGATSAEPAQNDLASLLTLSSDMSQEIFDPMTQEKEDKHEGKYYTKVPDRNGQTRVHRLVDFDECESSISKRQKVDLGSAAQDIENTECCEDILNKVPESNETITKSVNGLEVSHLSLAHHAPQTSGLADLG